MGLASMSASVSGAEWKPEDMVKDQRLVTVLRGNECGPTSSWRADAGAMHLDLPDEAHVITPQHSNITFRNI